MTSMTRKPPFARPDRCRATEQLQAIVDRAAGQQDHELEAVARAFLLASKARDARARQLRQRTQGSLLVAA